MSKREPRKHKTVQVNTAEAIVRAAFRQHKVPIDGLTVEGDVITVYISSKYVPTQAYEAAVRALRRFHRDTTQLRVEVAVPE